LYLVIIVAMQKPLREGIRKHPWVEHRNLRIRSKGRFLCSKACLWSQTL